MHIFTVVIHLIVCKCAEKRGFTESGTQGFWSRAFPSFDMTLVIVLPSWPFVQQLCETRRYTGGHKRIRWANEHTTHNSWVSFAKLEVENVWPCRKNAKHKRLHFPCTNLFYAHLSSEQLDKLEILNLLLPVLSSFSSLFLERRAFPLPSLRFFVGRNGIIILIIIRFF